GGLIVTFVICPDRQRLEDDDKRREPHSDLWKQVVKRYCERKVQPVNGECTVQRMTSIAICGGFTRLSYWIDFLDPKAAACANLDDWIEAGKVLNSLLIVPHPTES